MQTILKTQTATINGKPAKVETIKGRRSRQDIYYLVNDRPVSSDKFWGMKPVFSNQ